MQIPANTEYILNYVLDQHQLNIFYKLKELVNAAIIVAGLVGELAD